VALVNDYEVVVQGLASMLRSYQDRVQVVELDTNRNVDRTVDIALLDTFANTHDDQEGVRMLVRNPLVAKVVVYSWSLDQGLIESALARGADGYVSKGLPAAQLVSALETVHAGGEPVHTGTARTRIVAGDWPGREEGLTPRESEVLALIAQGLSNAEIADRAHLSINSVKSYIRSCYRRIGVTSRSHAVLWGIDHGFRPDRVRVHPPAIEQ